MTTYSVTFLDATGKEHTLQAQEGENLMNLAVSANIPGILGECGGAVACGTCHCYLAEDWLPKVAPADDNEAGMIEFVLDPQTNSRLSCQVRMTADLDGLVVTVPAAQY